MLYSFLRIVARIIVVLVNGQPEVRHTDRLPEGNYILVGPHRTWFDPIYYALAGGKKKFAFMAKAELFHKFFLSWLLPRVNAFPVDRDHPGPSAVKTPIKILKNDDKSLIIFPSGTRHSSELKGGAILIAKLAKVPLVPTVYQGPLTFKSLFSRKPAIVSFGEPIYLDKQLKVDAENERSVEDQMQDAFDTLDHEINPDFHYVDPAKKANND